MVEKVSLASVDSTEHVCIKKPCTFCLVLGGLEIPGEHLVQSRAASENRAVIARIVAQLVELDLPTLQTVEYVVQALPRAVASPAPSIALRLVSSH
jgi:hypothetical protein